MAEINDGGPAFPRRPYVGEDARELVTDDIFTGGSPGMSLRAYFAGLAMQGMLAGRKCELGDVTLTDMTESATKIADALIAALEVKHE